MLSKKAAGEYAVNFIEENMTIGLGTGSTVYYTIKKLGTKVKRGFNITAVPTSKKTEKISKQEGINCISISKVDNIDLTIDGADEIDPNLNLIKGGGGALLREKIVSSASKKLYIVVDSTKTKSFLGKFPLPIEIESFGWQHTKKLVENYNCFAKLRKYNNKTFITDNKNFILDCHFKKIKHPRKLSQDLNQIPGVIDTGIFLNMADYVFVGYPNGKVNKISKA